MTTDQACLEDQNLCKDNQLPTGLLCAGGDGGVRTSLLAAARGLAGELAVLRMVERDGGRLRCGGEQETGPKEGRGKTKYPESAN